MTDTAYYFSLLQKLIDGELSKPPPTTTIATTPEDNPEHIEPDPELVSEFNYDVHTKLFKKHKKSYNLENQLIALDHIVSLYKIDLFAFPTFGGITPLYSNIIDLIDEYSQHQTLSRKFPLLLGVLILLFDAELPVPQALWFKAQRGLNIGVKRLLKNAPLFMDRFYVDIKNK
eukprot:Pgem_evm4s17184